ncbi:carboxylesterase 3 [Colletotrichum kahawae]|uniref:Carboxylesterase 3 n=1 Tax=Colletotrichum kahawae TaxID=34407 RepID=A0AAD9YQJ7_COLKA|nr:carboxylesterase 3 [Colletotrichum kahawae]
MSSPTVSARPTKERRLKFDELVNALLSDPPSKFDPFRIYRSHYTSDDIDIGVDVLLPKSMKAQGLRPVIVRIHGGFLVTGSSLFPAWFTTWILDYAELHGAVIVSPDYRLLPEAKGVDILQDLNNFWSWLGGGGVEHSLASVGLSNIKLDLDRLLVVGESAGGYLALQSVLHGFASPGGMILAYPMIDLESPHYTRRYNKPIVGVPNFPDEIIREFLTSPLSGSNKLLTAADPPTRLDLAMSIVQNGRFLEFLGTEDELFPLRMLNRKRRRDHPILPQCFMLHGEEDSAVPVEGTRKFVAHLKTVDPSSHVHLAIQPGDHGFDSNAKLEDEWLAKGLQGVTDAWLN